MVDDENINELTAENAKIKKIPTLGLKNPIRTRIKQNTAAKRNRTVVVEHKKKRTLNRPGINKKLLKEKNLSQSANNQSNDNLTTKELDARVDALVKDKEQKKIDLQAQEKIQEIEQINKTEQDQKQLKEQDDTQSQTTLNNQNGATKQNEKEQQKTTTKNFAKDKKLEKISSPTENKNSKRNTKANKNDNSPKRDFSQRRRKILTINNALEDEVKQRSIASIKRRRERERQQKSQINEKTHIVREVIVPDVITIAELSNRMAERATEIIKFFFKQGQIQKVNDFIDGDTAQLLVEEFGHKAKRISEADVEESIVEQEIDEKLLKPRSPIVTIMGHVDHGKTTLIDAIRKTKVAEHEAGSITQHIGAYQVKVDDSFITFIDTPGHAAFSQMRSRGAVVTDIVVLVLAIDDGIKPQTIEAIQHIKAAKVPLIVAVNKIDKQKGDAKEIYQQLMLHDIYVEEVGGEVLSVELSAKTGQNLDRLLELIKLQSEVIELKAAYSGNVSAVVIDGRIEVGRGRVISVIVKQGILQKGNIFVVGQQWGKVRSIIDDSGKPIEQALPGMPVEVQGLQGLPEAGDILASVASEALARQITTYRKRKKQTVLNNPKQAMTVAQLISSAKDIEKKEFPVLVKADVHGSAEAIQQALQEIGNEEVAAKIVVSAVGVINETDVQLAKSVNAIVYGFNVNANVQARELAKSELVDIKYYSVIYKLIDDVKETLVSMLTPEKRETVIGEAQVLQFFKVTGIGKVAGCKIVQGKIESDQPIKIIRQGKTIYEGAMNSLRHFADEVKQVNQGQECGIGIKEFQNINVDDIIKCYNVDEIKKTLD